MASCFVIAAFSGDMRKVFSPSGLSQSTISSSRKYTCSSATTPIRTSAASLMAALSLSEIHPLEGCAAEEAVRARQRLEDLEMVVALRDQQARGLAGGLHGGGEIARLALELRRFQRAVREHERRVQPAQVALRAERVLHRIGELHVARARREPRRLEVEQAAA